MLETSKPLLSCADVAKLLGWTVKRARRWVLREELGVRIGHRWYTTPTKIREAFPEVYAEVAPKIGAS